MCGMMAVVTLRSVWIGGKSRKVCIELGRGVIAPAKVGPKEGEGDEVGYGG